MARDLNGFSSRPVRSATAVTLFGATQLIVLLCLEPRQQRRTVEATRLVRAKGPARTPAKANSPARVLRCGGIYHRRVCVIAVFLEQSSIMPKGAGNVV
jgi:hypothetical protein